MNSFPIKILVFTFCHNDAMILPFIIEYWEKYATKVVVYDNMSEDDSVKILSNYDWIEIRKYDTGNKFNPDKILLIKNSCYKECINSNIDYVMVCDLDEVLLYGDNLFELLSKDIKNNIKIIDANYYDIVNVDFPKYKDRLILSYSSIHPVLCQNVNKVALFDPNINIQFINNCRNYNIVNRNRSIIYKHDKLCMLHFKLVGLQYFVNKQLELINRTPSEFINSIQYGTTKDKAKYIFSSKNADWFNKRTTLGYLDTRIGKYTPSIKKEIVQVEPSFDIENIEWKLPTVDVKYTTNNNLCAIVIPIYKLFPDKNEIESLKQCANILGNKYDIFIVGPAGLQVNLYKLIYKNLNVIYLNADYFKSTATYSRLCLKSEFYQLFSKYTYMLIYQLDGWVFKDDLERICNFGYDYIGSPWEAGSFEFKNEAVGNGGISLRKIKRFIILGNENEYFKKQNPDVGRQIKAKYKDFEDLYICKYLTLLTVIDIAPVEKAVEFSLDPNPKHFIEKYKKEPAFAHRYFLNAYWKTYIKTEQDTMVVAKQETTKKPVLLYAIHLICDNENGIIPEPIYDYNDEIIVTMTSWPKRINSVETTLNSILDNTILPEKIVINLALPEFPNKEQDLPKGLVDLILKLNGLIEIYWLKNNTKVWKKSIPTLLRYPNALVLCIDDDFIYPKDFIQTFYEKHLKEPNVPLTGVQVKIHKGKNLHCGCSSLDMLKYCEPYIQFINMNAYNTGDEDSFMTYCYYKNNIEMKYVGKMFHVNMKSISNTLKASYSASRPVKTKSVWSCFDITPFDIDNSLIYSYEKPFGLSIIITAYNTADYIQETLDSILSLDWCLNNDNYEILIGIDGCTSTLDKMKEIMYNYKNIKVLYMKNNAGTFVTSNTLILEARYNKILRFDSDDMFVDNTCISLIMEQSKNYDIVRYYYKDYVDENNIKDMNVFAYGSVLYDAKVFEAAGGYLNWKCSGDYEFFSRVKTHFTYCELKSFIYYHRLRKDSLMHDKETSMKSRYRVKVNSMVRIYRKDENIYINPATNNFELVYLNIEETPKTIFLIINYNTPYMVECLCHNIDKFVPNNLIYIFDNSDKEPFTYTNDNIVYLDNTKGDIINFDEELSKYKLVQSNNNYASFKHCISVEKCMELIGDNFILLDSDILIKKDIKVFTDATNLEKYLTIGQVKKQYELKYDRVVPFICYINVKKCKELNIHYFDINHIMGIDMNNDSINYDTGRYFYELVKDNMLNIDISKYIIHYGSGSTLENHRVTKHALGASLNMSLDEWLKLNKDLYE